ncbi:MAG TPA: Ig-like domain repeat protein [Thermoanaerobaculia bacterium]|jgi:hypothetical protein|nr:Ig-like domain repeat protein [Thermoanaerobaculia bacterium]
MSWLTRSVGFTILFALAGQAGANTTVSTFGGNAQHTAVYTATAQNLNAIRWTTAIDLNSGAGAHYGSPLLTPANTIVVPVKTATDSFRIDVFNAADGSAKYSIATDYLLPFHNWIPVYQPALATSALGTRLYYPGAGGTIYYIDAPDSISHGVPVQQVFYTTLANYQANAAAFNSTVFINTPITPDGNGNIFFGFRIQGTAPAPLSTTQSGFARIDPLGNATYVLAGTAANDANIGRDNHNSAPALSNDQATLYVVVKSISSDAYGYLLGLDTTTLATKFKVFLKDPRNNNANNATLTDDSTASPMVAPDNDVYLGILADNSGFRGFLLRFSSNLTVEKTPGGFGWDNTPAIVPATMAPLYTGTSSYLIFTKYNDYANAGAGSGAGVNRIALLDPNATEVDPHAASNGMPIMREVQTVIGPTPDDERRSASFPLAVREWCINTAAVNPATFSVFTPSEDGHVYRWNLANNGLTQAVQISPGIGEPYVPTVIGPDGTVFTLNGGTLFALGSLSGVGITLTSSGPDLRNGVSGQSLTFTAAVTNTGAPGNNPTGTVTFQDTVYLIPPSGGLSSMTTVLAANVPLDGTGHASFTSSALNADNHFITALYSGDVHFTAGSATLVQKIHASATATTLAATPNPSQPGQAVTFMATVAAVSSGFVPTGMVTFREGTTALAQVPLNASGVAAFSTSALAPGSHTVTAVYASDILFAASSGSTVQGVQTLNTATATTLSSAPNPSASGQSVTFTATVTSGAGVPAGTVTFTEGATTLASNVTVNGTGHAAFSTAALGAGSHTLTASFTGAAGWANSSGNDSAAPQIVNAGIATTTFVSVGAQDGWVLESSETSNVGGSLDATAGTPSALRVGDDKSKSQYKTIVSFDTSAIPDGATILSATLRLRRGTVVGTSPFTTHGICWVDIQSGSGFSGSSALQTGDFQAVATAVQAASLSNAANNLDWSQGRLNAAGLAALNKTGTTQFRVYFALDDDDDKFDNYIGYYSGDDATAANRPQLVVTYQ